MNRERGATDSAGAAGARGLGKEVQHLPPSLGGCPWGRQLTSPPPLPRLTQPQLQCSLVRLMSSHLSLSSAQPAWGPQSWLKTGNTHLSAARRETAQEQIGETATGKTQAWA